MLELMGPSHSDALRHYIRGEHEWAVPVTRPEEDVSTEPADDNALPNSYVNNYFLGNILKDIFSRIHPKQKEATPCQSSSIVVCLIGLDFAGKHTLKSIAEEELAFTTIEAEKVVEQRLT